MSVTCSDSWIGTIASVSVAMAASSMMRCVGLMLSTTQVLQASLHVQNTAASKERGSYVSNESDFSLPMW